MNHIEAQSYIVPFIEDTLPAAKQGEFIMHVRNCPKCHDELEFYYTILTGMKQLDNNEPISRDFSKELEDKLTATSHKLRGKHTAKMSLFSAVMIGIVTAGVIFYTGCINRVYNFEQRTKLINQGEHYVYDTLGEYLYLPETDSVEASVLLLSKNREEITFYDRVNSYYAMKGDYLALSVIGEGLLNEDYESPEEDAAEDSVEGSDLENTDDDSDTER